MEPPRSITMFIHLPLVPVTLSQINPIQPQSYFFKIHFNIIIQYTPVPFKCSLSSLFPYRTPICIYLFPIHAMFPAHCTILESITQMYRSLSASQCTFLHHTVISSSFLGPSIVVNTPAVKQPQSVPFIWQNKFHIHGKQDKKFVLHILISHFQKTNRKAEDSGTNGSKHSPVYAISSSLSPSSSLSLIFNTTTLLESWPPRAAASYAIYRATKFMHKLSRVWFLVKK